MSDDFEVLPIGTKDRLASLERAANDAVDGITEGVRTMDLMGRGGDARRLDIYRNNLAAALRAGIVEANG